MACLSIFSASIFEFGACVHPAAGVLLLDFQIGQGGGGYLPLHHIILTLHPLFFFFLPLNPSRCHQRRLRLPQRRSPLVARRRSAATCSSARKHAPSSSRRTLIWRSELLERSLESAGRLSPTRRKRATRSKHTQGQSLLRGANESTHHHTQRSWINKQKVRWIKIDHPFHHTHMGPGVC